MKMKLKDYFEVRKGQKIEREGKHNQNKTNNQNLQHTFYNRTLPFRVTYNGWKTIWL